MVILFSVTVIGLVSGRSIPKGIIAGFGGLLFSTVGLDPIMGSERFTFGSITLTQGLAFIPMLIGLYGGSELLVQIENPGSSQLSIAQKSMNPEDDTVTWKELKGSLRTIFRAGIIGTFIGALPGIGTLLHLAIADLALQEKLDMNYVPMEGSKITVSVVGGHVDAGVHQPPIVAPYAADGKVKMLCTFSKDRLHWFPDVPTAKELGYDIEQEVWNFILTPKGTPADRMKWIHDAFKKTLEDKAFISTAEKLKIDIDYRTGEQSYKDVAKASKRYKEIVEGLGLVKK